MVYLSEHEYKEIVGQAAQAGLSTSKYVKRICLAQEVRSLVDQQAVLELMKSRADLGRLGGVLKHHLSETGGHDVWSDDLRKILNSIESSKREMSRQVADLTSRLLQKR